MCGRLPFIYLDLFHLVRFSHVVSSCWWDFFLSSLCSFLPFSFSSLKHSFFFILLSHDISEGVCFGWAGWKIVQGKITIRLTTGHLKHRKEIKKLWGREWGGEAGPPPDAAIHQEILVKGIYLFLNGSWWREVGFVFVFQMWWWEACNQSTTRMNHLKCCTDYRSIKEK